MCSTSLLPSARQISPVSCGPSSLRWHRALGGLAQSVDFSEEAVCFPQQSWKWTKKSYGRAKPARTEGAEGLNCKWRIHRGCNVLPNMFIWEQKCVFYIMRWWEKTWKDTKFSHIIYA